ncbi:M48 family metallopeptidase [Hoyosella rhizosphaerae]|uniref:Zn-dependent protease n=1 Tax=Hoyosella rhizosphaerae TaxID=1755582 RepID=A0A916U476_9ACTN|nr:M48 family metallopeptidase [Hoyosella rhizosphaerae]MBN4926734.1 M48 family metallopeptidase [Hoyosella rhizosphaerae]GGC56875.1 Zn-dependent protease [Hoyosella rhizosphaerae]
MNFFERQIEVKKSSRRLVVLFILAVLSIVVLANLLVVFLSLSGGAEPADIATFAIAATAITLVFIGGVSFFKTMMLRNGGGSQVARSLGAIPVPEDTTDPRMRRYRNVVEEIAIASSTPVPELFILPGEQGINAFAAGYTTADAAIAVTEGALERLNRDELQGVIAHEFAHVVNGDMRLNIRLIGVIAGLTALAVIGRVLLYSGGGRSSKNNNGAPIFIIGLIAISAGFIGVFFGRLIKAAVSRQRELLADASAVQFTRQTAGLAGALKKIGGLDAGSKMKNARTEDVSHMLFGEGMRFSSMYATHPPLVKRIKLLEPEFDERELQELQRRWKSAPPSGLREDQQMGLAAPNDLPPRPTQETPTGTPRQAPKPQPMAPSPGPRNAKEIVAGIGDPGAASYEYGEQVRRSIPESLADRAHHHEHVVPLVFGLLFSADENIRVAQHGIVLRTWGKTTADAAWFFAGEYTNLDPRLRLPLVEIGFPALRRRSKQELESIMATLSELIAADGNVSVFEYCLGTLIFTGLHESIHHRPKWSGKRHHLRGSAKEIATLLAVLAKVGHPQQGEAESAYQAGMNVVLPQSRIPFALPQQGILELESVWPSIDGLEGKEKQQLVEALVTVVMHDNVMSIEENELLRTVCAVLHCPVPPIV